MNEIKINDSRLWERLNIVGALGADPAGGISRFAWEPAYKEGLELLLQWARESGLSGRIDTVGNLFIRLEGTRSEFPAVLSGSHFDTVPHGGLFDGTVGVIGAFEVLLAIKESGLPHKRPIELVAFINEEASQFLGGTFGSKAICGMISPDYIHESRCRTTGQPLSESMKAFGMGLDPDHIEKSRIDPSAYYAFVEMHIEQGRYLLEQNLPLSVVSDIAGIKQFYIHFKGETAHAGGMAMKDRHDALATAAVVVAEVERLALAASPETRGTVGYIEAHPGEHNIIADECTISVDFRESDDIKWEKLYTDLMQYASGQCKKRGVTYTTEYTCNLRPAHCSRQIMDIMDAVVDTLSVRHNHMISFPAHDAINISRILPMAMIFLRSSNGGVSHCPEEFTTKADLTVGTQVLANTVYRLANEDAFL